jgi:membrane dipeptidase
MFTSAGSFKSWVRPGFWSGLLLLAVVSPALAKPSPDRIDEQARAIHARTLVLDSHVDVLLPNTPARYAGSDGKSAAELDKLLSGGVGAVALAVAVGPGARNATGLSDARREAASKLDAVLAFTREHADRVALAKSADDVAKLHEQGKVAVILSFLNARSIGTDLAELDRYHAAGVRLFGFTHAGHNDFADSSRPWGEEPIAEHHGLSALGKRAVERLNRLGVIIDVSQLTTDALLQTLELTRVPVVASHSAARALVDNPRNLSDPELEAIERKGGVVQVTAFGSYLAPPPKDYPARLAELRKRFSLPESIAPGAGVQSLPAPKQDEFYKALGGLAPKATLAQFVDHIDYIVKKIGIDHVGIGSDFNHGAGVIGFQNEGEAGNVTRELVRRGYDEAQIQKVWGGNFLRVFRAVEAESKKPRK